MLLNEILEMDHTAVESSSTTPRTTTRRLRSLHLPSSSSSATNEIGRRFNSLRRPQQTNNAPSTQSPLATTTVTNTTLISSPPIPSPPLPTTTQQINHENSSSLQIVESGGTATPIGDIPEKVHIKLVPNVGMTNRCFVFDVVDRELESGGPALKLGRYSDRTVVMDRISFKSKVVSRYHASIYLSEQDGKIYIKDSGSSSGTFVNHIRLTAANTESARPHEIMDGDLIQLGVDYKGGLEPMYRAVRIRLEVNRREWQETASNNTYSLAAFQQLKNQISYAVDGDDTTHVATAKTKQDVQECCICLYCIAPFQALFISPCAHVYHYRCLRPLLMQNYPGFCCPLCRTYSNLEASVAVEEEEVLQMLRLANIGGGGVSDVNVPSPMKNNSEEEEEEEEGDNSPLVSSRGGRHQREKTVLDEEAQEAASVMINEPPSLMRPSLFFQRQISSSDGGLAATLVGSPPRYETAGGGREGVMIGGGGMVGGIEGDYTI